MVCETVFVSVRSYTVLLTPHFFRLGYSNSDNSWLRRAAFAGSDLLNAFDEEAEASQLLLDEHRAEVEQGKARIEEATTEYQAAGMTYMAAYHKASTMEFARLGGRGKRVRTTTQPSTQ